MIETLQTGDANIVGFRLSGKLHDEDYKTFVPAIEARLTAVEKVRLFVQFEDFHGWDLHAAWDDFMFGMKHYRHFERIAMVGDHKWQEWMAKLCKPFTKAQVQYFGPSNIDEAWAWLREA
jgi:hypothetical protein